MSQKIITLTHCKYSLQGNRLITETKPYLFDGTHYYETNAKKEMLSYACSERDINRFRGYENIEYKVWSNLPCPEVLQSFRQMVTARLLAQAEKFNCLMDEREAPLDFSSHSNPSVDEPFPRYHAVLEVAK